MKLNANNRPFIALLLIACLLISAGSCAVRHGQAVGFTLSGLPLGQFCQSLGGLHSEDPSDAALFGLLQVSMVCPLCSAPMPIGTLLLFSLTWLLRLARSQPYRGESFCLTPPRYCWPAANPRAP